MLVYGDRSETVDPRAYAERLAGRAAALVGMPWTWTRDAAHRDLLIGFGKLEQGLADTGFEEAGEDGATMANSQAASLTRETAAALATTLYGGLRGCEHLDVAKTLQPVSPDAFERLLAMTLPAQIGLREPEGYAFYAVYPDLYFSAAHGRNHPTEAPQVIGLRSIGTSLAAAAAVGCDGGAAITLRPTGPAFERKLRIGQGLRDGLLRGGGFGYLVVDEGPGVSGSSFGAVGDLLEDAGVAPEAITYMPSHLGDLGPQASERHRARWRTATKLHAAFEDVILPRLPAWAEPLIGPLAAPLLDLSGGLWREAAGVDAPAWPEQERRKYLATTRDGRFLLKFAGLGGGAERKLARVQALHAAGFAAEPMGVADGFLVERWVDGPVQAPATPDVEALGRYLGFRARALAPPHGAADDELLRTMMRRNLALAGLLEAAERAAALSAGERGPPCAIDGRLHAWEWRRTGAGRLLKLDALDHCEAHDLVGAQDVAWDLAGAAIELDLAAGAAERLRRITAAEAGQAVDPRRVDFQTLAYLAFQIGWWTLAAQGCEGPRARARADRYMRLAAAWSSHA